MRAHPRPIVAVAKEFPSGHVTPLNHCTRTQFLYAFSGGMTVKTDKGIWVVPPIALFGAINQGILNYRLPKQAMVFY